MTTIAAPTVPLRDAARTRDAILRAAQKLFAAQGYTTTGVREVAAEAGVNSALVRRYFGSKEGLLRAAMEDLLQIEPFICGGRDGFGVRALGILLQGAAIPSPLAMMMLATSDPDARRLCRDLMQQRIILPLAEWLGEPGGVDRASQLNLLWMGFMTARQILALEHVLEDKFAPTRRWLEDVMQAIVDAGAPADATRGGLRLA